MPEISEQLPSSGWIFFDRDCRSCAAAAVRFQHLFARRGFEFAPLQESWVSCRLGLSPEKALEEMRVLTRGGAQLAGAGAVIYLAGLIWWMSPLVWLARVPGVRSLLEKIYRWSAAHRHCTLDATPGPTRWLGLALLPVAALAIRPHVSPWAFMWVMAAAIFLGCKWLTFSIAKARGGASGLRSAAYLVAWPGMDAARFLSRDSIPPLSARAMWQSAVAAFFRLALGASLLFGVARQASEPLLAGWLGMIGMVLLLHFGLFDLISIGWRKLRLDAPPIMNAPLHSTSVGEFWGRRWNGAFNQLVLRLVFRPTARRAGTSIGTLCSFGLSGLVHELVISLPANGGYGLPTAYFVLQGVALIAEHTNFGQRAGIGRGARGWLFTMLIVTAPAFWLFHPPFVQRVILPFMQAIGAL